MAERHPSRTLLLVPRPDEPDGIDAQLSIRCFPVGDRAVCGEVIELALRGARARCAGVDRAAAPDLRPAGVLPLARRAAVRVDGARAARRDHRQAGRRLDGVGAPARCLHPAGGALRPVRGVGHRVGADRALAVAARVAVAGRQGRAGAARARDASAGLSARRAGCARGWGTTLRSRWTSASGSKASISTGSRRRSHRAPRRTRATCSRTSSITSPATACTSKRRPQPLGFSDPPASPPP